jgi:hypothetical protein
MVFYLCLCNIVLAPILALSLVDPNSINDAAEAATKKSHTSQSYEA